MAKYTKYNLLDLAETALMEDIKHSLVNSLTDKLVEDFKKHAEEIVKQEVKQLTLNRITSWEDLYRLKTQVEVSCKWESNNV